MLIIKIIYIAGSSLKNIAIHTNNILLIININLNITQNIDSVFNSSQRYPYNLLNFGLLSFFLFKFIYMIIYIGIYTNIKEIIIQKIAENMSLELP